MAGVGFELKKLFRARTVAGYLKAYSFSALITTGPFILLTGMVLVVQLLFLWFQVPSYENDIFVASTVYAFIFSQIFSSGFVKVVTRYLSDCISTDNYNDLTASCFGLIAILLFLGNIIAAIFLWNSPLLFGEKLGAYLFFSLLMIIEAESLYLTAVKKFKPLIWGFAIGVSLSIVSIYFMLKYLTLQPTIAAFLGITGGLTVISGFFMIQIIRFFGMPRKGRHFAFLPYFDREWRLFLYAILFSGGIFLPNIIIWTSPSWGVTVAGTYRYAPLYDIVTFYAFLSMLPMMIIFVVYMETRFYETYFNYFQAITRKGNFNDIEAMRKTMVHTLWFELRSSMEFQFLFTILFLSCGTYILSWVHIETQAVNMFDVLLMAVYFVGVFQILGVILEYFNAQRQLLRITVVFFLLNGGLNIFGVLVLGESSYGFTFFIAMAISLFYAWKQLYAYIMNINYYIFCGQPMFYQQHIGWLTLLARRMYGPTVDCLDKEDGFYETEIK